MASTILVVDDRRINLRVVQLRLTEAGHRVLAAESGEAALTLIADTAIDLALVDMVMPGMSGLDLLHALRTRPPTMRVPVIMITGRSDPSAAVEALAAGADDWIAKPFAFDLLHARIARVLARPGAAGSCTDQARLLASVQALRSQVARLS